MWRDLYELAKRLLGISEELQRNRADIKELQQEMRLVSGAVQQLHFEIQSIRDELRNTVKNEQQARENALLRIENALLRVGRELPPSSTDKAKGNDT